MTTRAIVIRRAVRRYAADHGMGFETAMLMSVAALDGWLEAEMARERVEQDGASEAAAGKSNKPLGSDTENPATATTARQEGIS